MMQLVSHVCRDPFNDVYAQLDAIPHVVQLNAYATLSHA